MPKGQRQRFPDGWCELKCPGYGWTAVRVRTNGNGLPVGLELLYEQDGKHMAFWRERVRALQELLGMRIVHDNDRLAKENARLKRELEELRDTRLPGGVSS